MVFRWNPPVLDGVYLAVESEDDIRKDINIWIVNDTDLDLEYAVRTGSYASLDEGLLESTAFERDAVKLPRRSAVLFDKTDCYGLDWVDWYAIDLKTGSGEVLHGSATRPKGSYSSSRRDVPIPFTDKRGTPLPIRSM